MSLFRARTGFTHTTALGARRWGWEGTEEVSLGGDGEQVFKCQLQGDLLVAEEDGSSTPMTKTLSVLQQQQQQQQRQDQVSRQVDACCSWFMSSSHRHLSN